MVRTTTFILICAGVLILTESVDGKRRLQSPKASEFSQSLGAPMVRKSSAVSTLPGPTSSVSSLSSNFVYKVKLAWDYDPDLLPSVSTFTLYMGRSSGVYDYWTNNVGTNLSYTFCRTNWDEERMARHFFVVTAKDQDGTESTPSNEAYFPAFPQDHFRLTWTSNWDSVTIYETSDITLPRSNWNVTATLFSTNTYSDLIDFTVPCKFFSLDKPDTLTITVFSLNP